MSKAIVVLYKNFDLDNIGFGVPRITKKSQTRNIALYYNDDNEYYLQTPKCKITGDFEYSIPIETNKSTKMLQDLDQFIIETATEKSEKWFGTKLTKNQVKAFYRPLVKNVSSDGTSGTMYVNVSSKADFLNDKKEPISKTDTMHDLKENDEIKFIIKFNKIYIKPVNCEDEQIFDFKLTYEVVQAKVFINKKLELYEESSEEE